MKRIWMLPAVLPALIAISAIAEQTALPVEAGFGPTPTLPRPEN